LSAELLAELTARGVDLWFEGDRLRFKAPTGVMTPDMREQLAARRGEILAALRRDAERRIVRAPLSYNQRALWFIGRTNPESAAYNIGFAVRIVSAVNVAALRGAVQALVDRHAMLRTTYDQDDAGEPVQVVRGYTPAAFTVVDAAGWDDSQLHERVQTVHQRPFDLAEGPVLRTHLFSRSTDDHVLLLSVHHIAADGWSIWLLLAELRDLYSNHDRGTAATLPRPSAHYLDYVNRQLEMLSGDRGESLWRYWQQQLAGALPRLELPADYPRPAEKANSGASIGTWLGTELGAAVRTLARDAATTPYAVLLAAFFALLHHYTRDPDIIVGTPMLGRGEPEHELVVGDFVGMAPLRVQFTGLMTFRDLLAQVKTVLLGALHHQEYPFPLMVERVRPPRDPSRSPIFDVAFIYQKPQRAAELARLFLPTPQPTRMVFGGLELEAYPLAQQEGQFDVVLECAEVGDDIAVTVRFTTALFTSQRMSRLGDDFKQIARAATADPTIALHAVAPPDTARAGAYPGPAVADGEREELRF
jgi:hypothetical protein